MDYPTTLMWAIYAVSAVGSLLCLVLLKKIYSTEGARGETPQQP